MEHSSLSEDPNVAGDLLFTFDQWLHELSNFSLSGESRPIEKNASVDANLMAQLEIKEYMKFSELTAAVETAGKLGVKFPEGAYVQAVNYPVRDFVVLTLEDAMNKVSAATEPGQRAGAITELAAALDKVGKLYEGLGRQPDRLVRRCIDAFSGVTRPPVSGHLN